MTLFDNDRRRPPEQAPPSHPPQSQLNCPIFNPDGSLPPKGTPVYVSLVVDDPALDATTNYRADIVDPGSLIIRWPGCAPKGQGASVTVSIQGASWSGRVVTPIDAPYEQMGARGGDSEVRLVKSSTVPFKRTGVVRAQGRVLADDLGPFHPLGATLFWAPRGWREDRDRLKQNIQWLMAAGFDYIRILCAVDWEGEEIDPDWPDYQLVMAELIDFTYDECGMRVEPTLYGGGPYDVLNIAHLMVGVCKGREAKILHWEVANESYNNGPDLLTMQDAGEILRAAFPEHTIALSAPPDNSPQTAEDQFGGSGANLVTIHFERTWADGGWRTTRQGWDFNGMNEAGTSGEPAGPGSSVAEEWNPLHLAMMRATGIMVGGAAYILHNSSGIFGTNDPGRHRTANLWEMTDPTGHGWTIDQINAAVRGVDKLLPADVENWLPTNDGWAFPLPTMPITCTEWSEYAGPVKHYGATNGPNWISMPHGIKDHFSFKATQDCEYTVYDPLTFAVVATGSLRAGESATLPGAPASGHDEEADRQCAYIIRGTCGAALMTVPAKRIHRTERGD